MSARRRERARTAGDGRVASERKRRNRGGARGAPPRVVPRSPPPRPRACARGRARGRGWRARPPSPRRRSSRRRPGGPSRGSRDGDMAPKATTTTRGGSGTRPGVARAKGARRLGRDERVGRIGRYRCCASSSAVLRLHGAPRRNDGGSPVPPTSLPPLWSGAFFVLFSPPLILTLSRLPPPPHFPVLFLGGVLGLLPIIDPNPPMSFRSAGLRIWKLHMRFSSTVIIAPALSNSPQ